MTDNLLVLIPSDLDAPLPGQNDLITALTAFNFIGDTIAVDGHIHYRPGEDYLRHITYLGCSPVVAMGEPGATGSEFCHIEFIDSPNQAQFLSGDNMRPPRCPGCNYVINEWADIIEEWSTNKASYLWRCPLCGQEYQPQQLNWRQRAGLSHQMIKIYGVFESEAVPSDGLMAELNKVTQTAWEYFYIRQHKSY